MPHDGRSTTPDRLRRTARHVRHAVSMTESATCPPSLARTPTRRPDRRLGPLSVVVAEALRRQGAQVYCLGIKDHADPALAEVCDDFDWIGLGQDRQRDSLLSPPRRDAGHDGRQGPQGAALSAAGPGCSICPTGAAC